MSSVLPLTAGSESATQVSERDLDTPSIERCPPHPSVVNSPRASLPREDALLGAPALEWTFRRDWPLLWPLIGMIVVSLLIRLTDADLRVSGLFFDHERGTWPLERAEPWRLIYRQGPLIGIALGVAGAILAVLGRWLLPRDEWRHSKSLPRAGLFLALMLVLGPGLLINVGFKQLWGRPRPIQCREFGGERPFVPVGELAARHLQNSSFPSGHASVAFYLMAPTFVISRRRPGWATAFFLGGIGFGLGMGLIRIVQGAHFLSDVLWSGALVYFVGALLAKLILPHDLARESRIGLSGTP